MEMILEGTIKKVVDIQEGVSKSTGNAWKKATYVLTTDGQYPKDVAFSVFGDKINEMSLIAGERVRLGIDLASREWNGNGKWYTDVTAYVKLDVESPQPTAQPQVQEAAPVDADVQEESGLPF